MTCPAIGDGEKKKKNVNEVYGNRNSFTSDAVSGTLP